MFTENSDVVRQSRKYSTSRNNSNIK